MRAGKGLEVVLHIAGKTLPVGELVAVGPGKVFFRYAPAFLESGLALSPFKLPLSAEALSADTPFMDGLFGVFYDSLPDGWGRLLMDRALRAKGVAPADVGPLERLRMVGWTGHGALCYGKGGRQDVSVPEALMLDVMAHEAQRVLSGDGYDPLGELVRMGGSSGGARPKIFVGFNPVTGHLMPFAPDLPHGYEHWIIKFAAVADAQEAAATEYAYHLMALDAGLVMSACRLFEGQGGKLYFGTKRFDRIGNERLHLHSAAGLLHDNFRLSQMDYGHLMDAAFRLENHADAYQKVLRLAAFNLYAHNRDDHSKNVSFLMDAQGRWRLAPAYDLTFSQTLHGHHSMTMAGEGKNPGIAHLRQLAKVFGVDNVDRIVDEVRAALSNWPHHARMAGVGRRSTAEIQRVLSDLKR